MGSAKGAEHMGGMGGSQAVRWVASWHDGSPRYGALTYISSLLSHAVPLAQNLYPCFSQGHGRIAMARNE